MTRHDSWSWQCDRVIPSEPGAGQRLLDEIVDQLRHMQWAQRDVFAVQLAVEEALVNAIKHGNRCDPNKRVRVQCRLAPQLLEVEIEDEGPGFDPSAVPDPTAPELLDVPNGRGLMLMRNFMSRVEFNERGNRVVMEKQLDGCC